MEEPSAFWRENIMPPNPAVPASMSALNFGTIEAFTRLVIVVLPYSSCCVNDDVRPPFPFVLGRNPPCPTGFAITREKHAVCVYTLGVRSVSGGCVYFG